MNTVVVDVATEAVVVVALEFEGGVVEGGVTGREAESAQETDISTPTMKSRPHRIAEW